MKKTFLYSAALLCLSSASSYAALLLSFTEENNNVVLRVSGSVDLTNATFSQDGPDLTGVPAGTLVANGIFASGTQTTQDRVQGVDLLAGNFASTSVSSSNTLAGSLAFDVIDDQFTYYEGNGATDDDAVNTLSFTSDATFTWENQTFADLGLDAHATDVNIDLWGARTLANGLTDDEKVQFRVVSAAAVPEPSAMSLLSLGGIALLLRRKRQ